VRQGQYADAAKKSDELATEASIKKVLSIQTSAIITHLVRQIEDETMHLNKSISPQPDYLPNIMNNLRLLAEARKQLATTALISESVSQNCDATLAAAQVTIDQWFKNCINQLRQHIKNFQVHDFNVTMASLRSTVNGMHIKPSHWDNDLGKLTELFSRKLQQIINNFKEPIATWNAKGLRIPLPFIYQQLAYYDDKKVWPSLSAIVMNAANVEIARIQTEIAANSSSVSKLIAAISNVAQQIIDLPQEETQLNEQVLKGCQESIIQLINKITSSDINFDDYLTKICELVQEKGQQKYVFNDIDLTTSFTPLHNKIVTLRSNILNSLQTGQFPAYELSELISIYHRTHDFSDVIQSDLEICRKAMEGFTTKLFRELSNGLIAYQANYYPGNAEALTVILNSCKLLTQINQCRKEQTESGQILFDSLLPQQFFMQIKESFQIFLKLFNTNNENFYQSLHNKNIDGITSYLNFSAAWDKITAEIARYISACDEVKIVDMQDLMLSLMTYFNQSNHAASIKLIEREIAEMIARVTLNISDYLMNPEKGKSTREAYFYELINVMEFIVGCEKLKPHFDVTPYKDQLLTSTKEYLTQLYVAALKEIPNKFEDKQSFETFNDCYKDLLLFAQYCGGYQHHLGAITLNLLHGFETEILLAKEAVYDIDKHFNDLLNKEIQYQKEMIKQGKANSEQEIREGIFVFVISLQRIINTLPSKANEVKKSLTQLLIDIREKCGANYFQQFMIELQAEKSGLGLDMINQQPCFQGMSIALRNTRTSSQDIEYVLKELKQKQASGDITPLQSHETNLLRAAYGEFQANYDKLLADYLKPEVRFDDNPTKHLSQLLADLKAFIQKEPIPFDNNNNIIWNEAVTKKIPIMMAYLFVIWTLRDAKAFFDTSSSKDSTHYLKKPHPGQVIAIFRMLNIAGETGELSSHLVQVLSGEGKSIVVAITAEILALCGFSVSCACYSEYLCSRDFADFEKMFELLDLGEYIKYGTFNTLCEDILNEHDDLRILTENLITRGHPVAINKKTEKRQNIVIIDEVDVFFNRAFYGAFYNPVLRFHHKKICALIELIWNMHKLGHSMLLSSLRSTKEYKECITLWDDLSPLLDKAINEMLQALNHYKPENGHHYTLIHGKIAYPYQDGITSDIYVGYKTMWAYYHEYDQGKVNVEILTDNVGLLINCGNYAYSEILKEMGIFKCILGVTGTLRELSDPEQMIVSNEFSIAQQTFIPSVYGPNRLRFPKNESIKVENDSYYYHALAREIKVKRADGARPVLVFFEDQASLLTFYHHPTLKELGIPVSVMTQKSSSTTAEQNSEISKAMSPGQVTLVVKEKGRGRDFNCPNQKIEDDGGVHVILAFLPNQVALEFQLFYRTARQGQDGSASMVLREEDLKKQFQLTDSAIQKMRDNNTIYDSLNTIRKKIFAETYSTLAKEMESIRDVLHTPSFKFWQQLCSPQADPKNTLMLLQGLNQVSNKKQMQHVSRTLILMDATGSMSLLINGVKQTVTHVINNLNFVMAASSIAKDNLLIQLAIYRNYWESSDNLFKYSAWSNNANDLKAFIDTIEATGGSWEDGCEAIEVGLCHALNEAEKKDGLTQVILIGDMPPNNPDKLKSTEGKFAGGQARKKEHQHKFYSGFEPADVLTGKLAEKKIPIFTFFVRDYPSTKKAFTTIAEATGGTAEFLDANSENAHQNLSNIIGKTVLTDVAGEDEELKKKLLVSYGEISHRGMTKWLHAHDFCYKKAHGVPAKADREKQKEFIQYYKRLKKKAGKKEPIYFADSVHPQHQTQLTYGWIPKGERKEIATTGRQKRLNFIGGIGLNGYRFSYTQTDKVDAYSICDFLWKLRKDNPGKYYVHVIWDNAGPHTDDEVRAFAKELGIKLHYLPPYSPNLNPAERIWKLMHEKIRYNKYYSKFSEFTDATLGFLKSIGRKKKILRDRITDNFQILHSPVFAS